MIAAAGLPKAPCYFLGRDPLDETIGRVFRRAHDDMSRTDPTRTAANVNQSVISRTLVAAFFFGRQFACMTRSPRSSVHFA